MNAPAEAALAAVREATLAEMAVVRALFRLRGLPAERNRPLWERMAATGFRAFAEPDRAKMSMDVSFQEGVLSTETRVWLTDARSRRRFRLYWLVVRPFSGLVRRGWLRAAKRRAEAAR